MNLCIVEISLNTLFFKKNVLFKKYYFDDILIRCQYDELSFT